MEKIKIYTCASGIRLFKQGGLFSAWTPIDEEYEFEEGDIAILVNSNHIAIDERGIVDILSLDSVEIC